MSLRIKYLEIFLSYSVIDRKLAGQMKRIFNRNGLKVFLAHDTIKPSADWQDEILQHLQTMDVFIPLLTNNFKNSNWTGQETGIAIQREVLIIPLNIEINPYGFIQKYQAINISKISIEYTCEKLIKIIYEKMKNKFLDSIILYFSKSDCFDDANERAKLIRKYDGYTVRQLNKILKISYDNSQIHGAYTAQNILRNIISVHKSKLNKKLVTQLLKKL
jgi:hypothetical protein